MAATVGNIVIYNGTECEGNHYFPIDPSVTRSLCNGNTNRFTVTVTAKSTISIEFRSIHLSKLGSKESPNYRIDGASGTCQNQDLLFSKLHYDTINTRTTGTTGIAFGIPSPCNYMGFSRIGSACMGGSCNRNSFLITFTSSHTISIHFYVSI